MLNNYDEKLAQASTKEVILTFQSVTDLTHFKKECDCAEFYVDRDSLSIVGTFTQDHIRLAVEKYGAFCKLEQTP